jgi:hypothetical protein
MNAELSAVVLLTMLFLSGFVALATSSSMHAQSTPDVYFGVQIGYGDINESKALIDRVSAFTNFILIGTTNVSYNSIKLNETFQYANDHGMSFMSMTPSIMDDTSRIPGMANKSEWFGYANQTWGDRLLGFYQVPDEPGGTLLDSPPSPGV